MIALGFDTSNYTTSIAAHDGAAPINCSQLLDVQPGQLGLRQSDALFAHIKRLPALADRLFAHLDTGDIAAIGVSTRPRAVEGSYMPCFLAGSSQAAVLARALGVPLYEFSHQQGHIAAALWSAGRMDLLYQRHLAWHLSGGTTELLLVENQAGALTAQKLGGTTDISAGQLIDRTGKLLSLPRSRQARRWTSLPRKVTAGMRFVSAATGRSFPSPGWKIRSSSILPKPATARRQRALRCVRSSARSNARRRRRWQSTRGCRSSFPAA